METHSTDSPANRFFFTDGHTTWTGQGARRVFDSVDKALASSAAEVLEGAVGSEESASDAQKSTSDVHGHYVVGALPFFPHHRPALWEPESIQVADGLHLPACRCACIPPIVRVDHSATVQEHACRVEEMVKRIQSGELDKVVLSRSTRFHATEPVEPELLLRKYMEQSSTGHAYCVSLAPQDSSSGSAPAAAGPTLVGASPELLISKRGRVIESFPLAGTLPRLADPVQDKAQAIQLSTSGKDSAEHAFVTAEIRRILAPLCEELDVPERPQITSTQHTWHLGTPIRGVLKNDQVDVLELAAMLHPTPAVGGFPTAGALQILQEQEPDRGFYAGAVGFSDANGDGQWRVVIRSAVVEGNAVVAGAGGGIVADSRPEMEAAETRIKFGPVYSALGLAQ